MKEIEYLKNRGVDLKEPKTLTWEEGVKILKSMGELSNFGKEVIVEDIKDEPFELYTSNFCLCDGTHFFLYDCISRSVANILSGLVFNKNKYTLEEYNKAKIVRYKVGKIVIDSYLDENAKDFRNYAFNTFIPYKMEIVE